jgi:NTE family protein
MWHTHPASPARASSRDLAGMVGLVASQPERESVMLIVSPRHEPEELSAYVFNGDDFRAGLHETTLRVSDRPAAAPETEVPEVRDIGLALSGGGARALAFHLGCLRAMHDRGLLPRIRVISAVSGGALMTALFAYGDPDFEAFDDRVVGMLRHGLQMTIARRTLMSRRLPEGLAARVIAGAPSALAWAASRVTGRSIRSDVRRARSRTDAFADVLRELLGGASLAAPRRQDGLDVVINACDLRSGTAFRFGSKESTSSRYGTLTEQADLATAVAASAAYPMLLPALDREWTFTDRRGATIRERVILTDGGVFDNSGTSCLMPGRSPAHTGNIFPVDFVIACDAGRGQLREKYPIQFVPRLSRAFESSFRKLQDASRSRLHVQRAHGELAGFVMPYLGQHDRNLPWQPPDLVSRAAVADYPTDFRAMRAEDLDALARRGEQLTRLLVERWCPSL